MSTTNNSKNIRKLHCYSSDETEEDSENELKPDVSEIFEANKPPPIDISADAYEIIEIEAEKATASKDTYIKVQELPPSTETLNLTKSQRKRRRKRKSNKKSDAAREREQIQTQHVPACPEPENWGPTQIEETPEPLPTKNTDEIESVKASSSRSSGSVSKSDRSNSVTPKKAKKKRIRHRNKKRKTPLAYSQNDLLLPKHNCTKCTKRRVSHEIIDHPEKMLPLVHDKIFMDKLSNVRRQADDNGIVATEDELILEVFSVIVDSYTKREKGHFSETAIVEEVVMKTDALVAKKEQLNADLLQKEVDVVLTNLGHYIVQNSTYTGAIYQQIDDVLVKLQSWKIPISRAIYCVSIMLKKVVWIFNNSLQYAQRWNLNYRQVVYDVESIILETVMERNYEMELKVASHFLDTYIFNSLSELLMTCIMRFCTTMYFMMKLPYMHNPLFHMVNEQNSRLDKKVYYLSVAKVIALNRTSIPQGTPFFNTPTPPQEAPSIQQVGAMVVQNLPKATYVHNYNLQVQHLKETYKNSEIDTRSTLLKLDRFAEELVGKNNNKSVEKIDEAVRKMSQEQPLIIEDMAENRKYFYDGTYFEKNQEAWRSFQDLYFQGSFAPKKKTRRRWKRLSQSYPHSCVINDLTANWKYFYDGSYSEADRRAWMAFQDLYFNGSLQAADLPKLESTQIVKKPSIVELEETLPELLPNEEASEFTVVKSDLERVQTELGLNSFGNSDDSIMVPIKCLLECEKARKIFISLIFILFFKKIVLWCFKCFYHFIEVSDIVFSFILLFYVCIYFVVKF